VTLQNSTLGLGVRTNSSDVTNYVRDPGGTPIGEIRGSSHYYYMPDRQGSIVALLDSAQTVQNAYRYGPYGQTTAISEPVSNKLKYLGQYHDSHDVYHFGQRWYDPRIARFTQRDPVAMPFDLVQGNRFPYAGGDPVNNADAAGLWSISLNFSAGEGVGLSGAISIGSSGFHVSAGGGGTAGPGASILYRRGGAHKGLAGYAGGCLAACYYRYSGSGHTGAYGVGTPDFGLGASNTW
jgi:RHS repeat-associated protein